MCAPYGETRTVLFGAMVPRFMTQKLPEDSTGKNKSRLNYWIFWPETMWDILDGLYPTEGELVSVSMAAGASNKGER